MSARTPKPADPLRDSDEQQAIADKVAVALEERGIGAVAKSIKDEESQRSEMENLILVHEKECREQGPIKELRADVSQLKAWVKAVGLTITILQLLNAYGQFLGGGRQLPIPSAAHASEISGGK